MPFFGVPIRNGLPIGLGSVAGFGVQQFDPSQLFEGGTVPGAWYDPSDLSTMFTTSAGTTPVAMPGQGSAVSVGLMLDKSQGLVLGSQLVADPGFDDPAYWTANTGWSVTGGKAVATAVGPAVAILRGGIVSAGKFYKVTYTATVTSGSCRLESVSMGYNGVTRTTSGTFTEYIFPTTGITGNIAVAAVTTFTGTIDNISVRELPGNHAISFNNTTARPELRARVNLLTYSEEFDNGAWTKQGATISATNNLAPDGTLTARTIRQTATNTYHAILQTPFTSTGATQTFSSYVKQGTSQFAYLNIQSGSLSTQWVTCVVDLSAGVITQQTAGAGGTLVSATITPAANNFWRVVLTGTIPAGTSFYGLVGMSTSGTPTLGGYGVETFLGSTANEIIAWGADLRPANIGANVPAYQRIADALTYDTSGFPLYLYFDGSDDVMSMSLAVSTLNLSVFAGVRETGNSINNNRYFFMGDATGIVNNLGGVINGQTAASSSIGYRHPENEPVFTVLGTQTSAVISYQRTSTTLQAARLNGIAATSNTNLTTTFTSAIGRIGCVVSSSANIALFPGNIYSLIIAGSAVSAGNISATEQWVAGKTGISIFNDGPSITLNFDGQTYQVWEI